MMRTLGGPLSELAEVSAVPFPSPSFDKTAREAKPELVVVDVTYLSEERVRPLMLRRFGDPPSVVVFTSESGGGWVDDLPRGRSDHLASHAPSALLALLGRPALHAV